MQTGTEAFKFISTISVRADTNRGSGADRNRGIVYHLCYTFCIVRCGLPIIVFYKMFVPVIIFNGVDNPQSQCCLLERVGLQH